MHWKGWPYIVVVAVKDIKEGEELLADYQDTYWKVQREHREVWRSFDGVFTKLKAVSAHGMCAGRLRHPSAGEVAGVERCNHDDDDDDNDAVIHVD